MTTQRHLLTILLVPVVSLALLTGCRNEMYDMEYSEPLEKCTFFEDGRSARPCIEGTVARGELRDDAHLYTGKTESGTYVTSFPMEVTESVMLRGQERYNIFCSPCHGLSGRADGVIVKRGMKQPPSFLEQRLIDSEAGYFFEVISNGFGVMYSYASRIKPEDRWAIIAYLRALQRTDDPIATVDETVAADEPSETPAEADAGAEATADAEGSTESEGR